MAETLARRTVDQSRALYAHSAITQFASKDGEEKGKTLVKGLGAMTQQNGLGQALAFLLAGAEGKPHKPEWRVYDVLSSWLTGAPDAVHPERVYPQSGRLMEQLMAGDRRQYQAAQRSALALCGWLSKFADALLTGEGRR